MEEPASKLAISGLVTIAVSAVGALTLALRKLVLARRSGLTEKDLDRVRAEIDHVVNNFAMILVEALNHAEHGYWISAKESILRWSQNHPAKRG